MEVRSAYTLPPKPHLRDYIGQDAQCENFSVRIHRAPHVHNIFSGQGSCTLPNIGIHSSVQQLIIEKPNMRKQIKTGAQHFHRFTHPIFELPWT
ncbi:hypothetical protein KY289_035695 [Solanum tuberosum]|nr:hypothetical protein KY289_035695 [Solanum tuberosum]